jgi:hypothetical protein
MPDQVFTAGQILTAQNQTDLQNNIGLTFIKSQTIGTAVSSVSVTSAFSSAFENYKIVFTVNSMSGNGNGLIMTLDSTNITSTYFTGGHYNFYNAGTYFGLNVNNGSSWQIGWTGTGGGGGVIELCRPNVALNKSAQTMTAFSQIATQANHYNSSTAQATGFTITPSGLNMTGGVIKVYGYRD